MQINAYFKIITRNANGINSSIKKEKTQRSRLDQKTGYVFLLPPPPRNITLDE